jgi:Transposase IS66 family
LRPSTRQPVSSGATTGLSRTLSISALLDGLALRDQRDEDVIDAEEFGLKFTELERRTDELLGMSPTNEPNRRLHGHLRAERRHMFTFLTAPGVQATNWRAEQAPRPAVVNRKSWGGNRSWAGAHTEQIAISVIRAARQQQQRPDRADGRSAAPVRSSSRHRAMVDRSPLPELRYRIVCYELADDQQTVILDATAQGFIAVTGTITDDGTMRGEGTHAGPLSLQRRLARLIADDE